MYQIHRWFSSTVSPRNLQLAVKNIYFPVKIWEEVRTKIRIILTSFSILKNFYLTDFSQFSHCVRTFFLLHLKKYVFICRCWFHKSETKQHFWFDSAIHSLCSCVNWRDHLATYWQTDPNGFWQPDELLYLFRFVLWSAIRAKWFAQPASLTRTSGSCFLFFFFEALNCFPYFSWSLVYLSLSQIFLLNVELKTLG